MSAVGLLNCSQAEGLDVPYSCEEPEFPVAFNEWTHIGIYRGGNGAEVYLNGEHVAGNINPTPPNFFGGFANQFTLGSRDDGTGGFIGLIDDFKVQGEVTIGVHDMDINLLPPPVTLDCDFDGDAACDGADIDLLMTDWVNGGAACLLYTSPSPRDATLSRMPSSA